LDLREEVDILCGIGQYFSMVSLVEKEEGPFRRKLGMHVNIE